MPVAARHGHDRSHRVRALVAIAIATLVASCTGSPSGDESARSPAPSSGTEPTTTTPRTASEPRPLAGRTIVIDPGHQLGNATHPRQINETVEAGGFRKPCNSTGTATDADYPEATFTFGVARALRHQLRERGATVVMTRTRNDKRSWGPCVDVRGRAGSAGTLGLKQPADAKVSVHGDGTAADGHGFHVISPRKRPIRASSRQLAKATSRALRHGGFNPANYTGDDRGLTVRDDLGTLNLSTIPAVMAELGNMRNAHDAKVMRSSRGQRRYAAALADGLEAYLAR